MREKSARRTGLPKRARLPLAAVALFLLFTSSGCAPTRLTATGEPTRLTAQGMDYFNRGNYFSALEAFKEVRDRYPFSNFSLLAELKSADSHFYMNEYAEARALYEDFVGKHPTNEAIPYVLFQIGMCHFKGIDTIDRDPGAAHEAIAVFTRLLRTYPSSSYVVEAKTRVATARDFLAQNEMYVARFYVRAEKWAAAAGRLEYILQQYPDSSVAPKAKEMLPDIRRRQQDAASVAEQKDERSLWQRLGAVIFPG